MNIKKAFVSCGIICALVMGMSNSVFASYQDDYSVAIPQKLIAIVKHEEDGEVYYEYQWEDNSDGVALLGLSDAEWVYHTVDGLELKHRAAKEYSQFENTIRAASETVYARRHYSRAQIVSAVLERVLADSDRVYANQGSAIARSPYILNDWGYALRSYWG